MSTSEDNHLLLINSNTSNVPSIIKYPKSSNETSLSPAAINMNFNRLLSNNSILSLEKSNETINEYEHNKIRISKQTSVRHLSISVISRQLHIRKFLQNRLRFISNLMCFIGLLGIILMIIANEITFVNINNKDTDISRLIKLVITISTIILINLIIYYHNLNLKFYAAQNSLDDWRTGLTFKRIFLIIFEIIICTIHPIPNYFIYNSISKYEENKLNSTISILFTPSFNVALSLPMFSRLYLICRCIMYHSHLIHNIPSKSLSSFNKVSINFSFLFKKYFAQWPTRCLIIFCLIIFLVGSWSIRACDYNIKITKHMSLFDSMWLFIITITTVGYGDLTPTTYCGRFVTSIIALIGIFSSALLVSVVTKKLELTRWEKYVHKFVSNIDLTREHRDQAANIIKFSIKIWYLKRKINLRSVHYLKIQRKLYKSIHYFQKIKQKQRKLNENNLDLIELINIQRYISNKTKKVAKEITTIKTKLDNIEEKFIHINNTINNIQYTLHLLLNKNSQ